MNMFPKNQQPSLNRLNTNYIKETDLAQISPNNPFLAELGLESKDGKFGVLNQLDLDINMDDIQLESSIATSDLRSSMHSHSSNSETVEVVNQPLEPTR